MNNSTDFKMPYRIYGKVDQALVKDKYLKLSDKPKTPPSVRYVKDKSPSTTSTLIDKIKIIKKVYDVAQIIVPEPPQEGLVQIFNSPFYMTPDTLADPQDCDRYPDSPLCGGFPLDYKFASLKPSIVYDECNLGVQLGGTFGFIKVPPIQIVYRNPECQMPSPPPEPNISKKSVIPIPASPNCNNPLGLAYVKKHVFEEQVLVPGGLAKRKRTKITEIKHIYYPVLFSDKEVKNEIGAVIVLSVNLKVEINMEWLNFFGGTTNSIPLEQQQNQTFVFDKTYNVWSRSNDINKQNYRDYSDYWLYPANGENDDGRVIVTFGGISDWQESGINNANYSDNYINGHSRAYNYDISYPGIHDLKIWDVILTCGDYVPAPYKEPPPPPPPPPPRKKTPKNCECMSCGTCPDYSDLLKLLLARVNKLSKIVGVDEYPASMPASMITKNGKHPSNISIANLTQLFGWYVERFDELVGQFEIDIEIEDADLIKEGNQSQTIRLPNIAESIAELTGMLIKTSINSELLINICNRALIEAGQDKQQNYKSYMAVQSIIEYMGFNYREIEEKIPLTFTPGAESFDKMLKETQIPVKIHQYDEKGGLKAQLQDLLHAAAVIRAVHWRRLDPNKDMAKQLKETIMNAKKNKDKLNEIDFNKLVEELSPTGNNENS